MKIDVYTTKSESFESFLKEKIKTMNNEVSPYHKISRAPDYIKPYYLHVSEEGTFIGGLSASIYWTCMEINDFFIEEPYRLKGIGSGMLNKAIQYAKSQDLEYIWLKTFGFQAKDFYVKFGFVVVGELEHYPPPHSLYTMKLILKK